MVDYKIIYGDLNDFKEKYKSILDGKIAMFEVYGSFNRNQWQRAGRKYPRLLLKFLCEYENGKVTSIKFVRTNPYEGTFVVEDTEYINTNKIPIIAEDMTGNKTYNFSM